MGIRMDLPAFSDIPDRGREPSRVEDLTFSAIDMQRVDVPLTFKIAETPATMCAAVRDIRFLGVTARGGKRIEFCGRRDAPLKDFTFVGCRLKVAKDPVFVCCDGFKYDHDTFDVGEGE